MVNIANESRKISANVKEGEKPTKFQLILNSTEIALTLFQSTSLLFHAIVFLNS